MTKYTLVEKKPRLQLKLSCNGEPDCISAFYPNDEHLQPLKPINYVQEILSVSEQSRDIMVDDIDDNADHNQNNEECLQKIIY